MTSTVARSPCCRATHTCRPLGTAKAPKQPPVRSCGPLLATQACTSRQQAAAHIRAPLAAKHPRSAADSFPQTARLLPGQKALSAAAHKRVRRLARSRCQPMPKNAAAARPGAAVSCRPQMQPPHGQEPLSAGAHRHGRCLARSRCQLLPTDAAAAWLRSSAGRRPRGSAASGSYHAAVKPAASRAATLKGGCGRTRRVKPQQRVLRPSPPQACMAGGCACARVAHCGAASWPAGPTKRVTALLLSIHVLVCTPLQSCSRQGAADPRWPPEK